VSCGTHRDPKIFIHHRSPEDFAATFVTLLSTTSLQISYAHAQTTMATFQQIYANLFLGAIVFCLSLVAFGFAFRWEFNNQLAPRSWSRPKAILKNVLQRPYFYSWIPWSMKLTYPDLMDGIPGTGTRKDGWSGPMLKCNLDGIVMLKFHTMMLKISILASVLCMFIVLPLNYTAQCDTYLLGAGTCGPLQNLTSKKQKQKKRSSTYTRSLEFSNDY
jgi:hypothetical protein